MLLKQSSLVAFRRNLNTVNKGIVFLSSHSVWMQEVTTTSALGLTNLLLTIGFMSHLLLANPLHLKQYFHEA